MMRVGLGSLVKSVLNGKKGFSGNEEGFKAENFTRHINEGGIKSCCRLRKNIYSAVRRVQSGVHRSIGNYQIFSNPSELRNFRCKCWLR